MRGCKHGADARTHRRRTGRRGLDRLDEARRRRRRLHFVAALEEDREAAGGMARADLVAAHLRPQAVHRRREMPGRIRCVGELDADHQHREPDLVAAGHVELPREVIDELRPPEGAGQRVALDGALGPLGLEAVGDDADDAVRAARAFLGIGEPAAAVLDPHRRRRRPARRHEAVGRRIGDAVAAVASRRRHDRLVARHGAVRREMLGVAEARRQAREIEAGQDFEVRPPTDRVRREIPVVDDFVQRVVGATIVAERHLGGGRRAGRGLAERRRAIKSSEHLRNPRKPTRPTKSRRNAT